uniref:Pentraxin (PTX) domain-containing protein n=1 Tax=Hucho hucho TaxID=62062 RepID=A0A4W5RF11_9TELE
ERRSSITSTCTSCYSLPINRSGKMLTFPQETNTAQVSFTDLRRNHILFSLATSTKDDSFAIFKRTAVGELKQRSKNSATIFDGQDYTLNTWHSICAIWASETGLGQLWLDGKTSTRKFLQSDSSTPIFICSFRRVGLVFNIETILRKWLCSSSKMLSSCFERW